MARPRKNALTGPGGPLPANLSSLAESLGEALGRGVARGINQGLSGLTAQLGALTGAPRRRGRPPKFPASPVPSDRRCSEAGCPNPSRSKGLCSKHYQAKRREQMSS